MTVKVKWGSTWTTVNPGKMKIKWGTTWRPGGVIKVRRGQLDNSDGYWTDTGYIGIPSVPPDPTLVSWDYGEVSGGINNQVVIKLPDPSGYHAVPIDHYELKFMGPQGGELNRWNIDPSVNTATVRYLDWETRYQFATRSVGNTGLFSDWCANNLRLEIGKPATTTTKNVTKTRAWSKTVNLDMYRDAREGSTVPADVVVAEMYFDVHTTFAASTISDPGSTRTLHLVIQGNEGGAQNWANPKKITVDIKNSPGEGKFFGAILHGTGWSTQGVSTGWRTTGTLILKGTETYQDTETVTVKSVPVTEW